MKTLLISAAAAASLIPAVAMAQSGSVDDAGATRRIEPYVGVMGGVHNFDSETGKEGIPPVGYKGRMVEGVAGVNYNVAGPLVVGVEGTASKGVSGDIDWEYGVAGRAGVARAAGRVESSHRFCRSFAAAQKASSGAGAARSLFLRGFSVSMLNRG